jgi:hypothetical protein
MIVGMIALIAKTATGMSATIGTTALLTAVNDRGHLLAAQTMTIVAPGLRPLGGRLMIEGLQGTNPINAGTTEDARMVKMSMMTGLAGTPMEMGVGAAKCVC